MVIHDTARTRAQRRHSYAFSVRPAYRRDPETFDCMGKVLGWPLVIGIAIWFIGFLAFHAIRG